MSETNSVPSAVGTNRSYWETIKENILSSWEKIKHNTFANMVLPLEDLAEGNTLALLPYVVPGGGVVRQSVKEIKAGAKPPLKKLSRKEIQEFMDEAEDVGKEIREPGLVVKIGDEVPATRIQSNYENAMHRRRDYTYPFVGENAADSYGLIGRDGESMLLSLHTKNWKPGQLMFFSHFAPANMREGYNLIQDLVHSPDPLGLAVTEDLAPMLEKAGMHHIADIPQFFAGEIVNKKVFVNPATKWENIVQSPMWDHISYWLEPKEIRQVQKQFYGAPASAMSEDEMGMFLKNMENQGSGIESVELKQYPNYAEQMIQNSTIPRMIAMRQGENPVVLSNRINQVAGKSYQLWPEYAFVQKYSPRYTGIYTPATNQIAIKNGYTKDSLPHEIRHKIDEHLPLTEVEQELLNRAYGLNFNFANYGLTNNPEAEWVTTNFDIRRKLLGDYNTQHLPMAAQNNLIDSASDDALFNAIKEANGYGQRYASFMGREGFDAKTSKNIREALKRVGIASAPVTGGLLYNNYLDYFNGQNNQTN